MKSVFMIMIIFSLFISGCELVDEKGNPQFSYPSEDGPLSMQLDAGRHGGGTTYFRTSICENAFYGTCGNPSGEDIAEVHCSASANLGCAGLCYVDIDSQACGLYDASLGNCYCLNDGICHDTFGEPITSPDCGECTFGDTQSCNLPQVPGTCGECNEGLKICTDGQWSECEQVTDPIAEDCSNNLDDDCDCNADATDADCLYTHLECVNEQCVEVDGQGSDQCSGDNDCTVVINETGDPNWMRAYPTQPFVWGGGVNYTTCQDECGDAGYGNCVASNGASGQCDALVSGGDIIKGTVYNNIMTGNMNGYDSCNQSLFAFANNRNWCCCESAPETDSFCGDAVIQNPNDAGISEFCDVSDFGSNTCTSLGYDGGSLSCESYNCRLDKSGCDDTCRNSDGDGYYHNAISHLGNQLYEIHHGSTFDGNNVGAGVQVDLPAGYYSFECSATRSRVSLYRGTLEPGFWGPYPTPGNVLVDLAAECDCHYDYGAFEMPGPNVTYDNHYTTHDCAGQTMNREILIYLSADTYSIYVAPPSGVFAGSDLASYGRLSESLVTCTGVVDCDDDDASIRPGLIENTLNFKDDNCDGLIDVV